MLGTFINSRRINALEKLNSLGNPVNPLNLEKILRFRIINIFLCI
jgi:hypothetical protein